MKVVDINKVVHWALMLHIITNMYQAITIVLWVTITKLAAASGVSIVKT